LFDSLKNLFGGKKEKGASPLAAADAGESPAAIQTTENSPFLSREAVFDRKNRLAGHLFSLQGSSLQANADNSRQLQFDQILLDTLNASQDAWNTSLAFIPLSSASLALPAVDRLKTANVVLLVQLADDADPAQLVLRLETLRERGLAIGIFRQPKNPAFTQTIQFADYGVVDVSANEATSIRDFSAAFRASERACPAHLFGGNIETLDDHRFCHQWHYDYFHGPFSAAPARHQDDGGADPHKVQLLNLLRLVQGDAETAEIAEAMKQDPLLAFRILRYLNSAALGLDHRIDSLGQALIILGRQRLTRWLSVLLFSVRDPNFGDWLLVESALTRGRLMEELGHELMPDQPKDPLFLTGIFSCLDRLLRRPLAEVLDDMPLSDDVRAALLERRGPFAALLAVAEASDAFDLARIEKTALAANAKPDAVNRALLAATAWASEVTEHWE
jgi:EAL and modified HD-GYP domain-containing signal transduction protein